jgi:hypothetical protein
VVWPGSVPVPQSDPCCSRYGLDLTDGVILSVAFLLCIAFGPTMSYPSWTPRMALVVAILPLGVLSSS